MVTPNPAWPLLHVDADFTAGPPGAPGINRRALDKANGLIVSSLSTKRGRQYELGQCEAGTATLEVVDPKEVLNPGNATSPFMTGGNTILPYRSLQIWALWNSATGGVSGNILNTANRMPGQPDLGSTYGAYGYDPSFESWNPAPGWFYLSGDGSSFTQQVATLPSTPLNSNTGFEANLTPWVVSGGTAVQSSTQKHSGSFAAQITPTGAAAQSYLQSELIPVTAGNAYCSTAWLWATAAVTSNATANVNWFNSSQTYLSSSGVAVSLVAGTWTQIQNTVTAPAGAAYASIVAGLTGTPPASNVFYVDDASLTNATNPADGTYQVTKVSLATSNSVMGWIPRATPGAAYTLYMDVYAPTGATITFSYGSYSTTTTATGTYQTLSLPITASTSTWLQFKAATTGTFPVVMYYANYRIQGTSPGWSQTAGSAMSYTQVQAHSGAFSLGTVLNASTDSMTLPLPTAPGITYTMSSWVYAVGAGSVVRVSVGGSTASSSTVGAWQRLTVTFVASDAVAMVSWSAPSGTFPVTAYVDDIQLEAAATASAYTTSGPTAKALHTGYVERFPQTWKMQGSRGLKPLVSVDALAVLSRTQINQTYRQTILADNPTLLIPYSDKAIPQVVVLPQGGQPPRGLQLLGTSGSVNFSGDTFLDGSSAVTVVQQNTSPPASGNPNYTTTLETQGGSISVNRDSFSIECWIRWSSGAIRFGAGFFMPGDVLGQTGRAINGVYWAEYQGQLTFQFNDATAFVPSNLWLTVNGQPYTADGQWHYLVISSSGGNSMQAFVDGVSAGSYTWGKAPYKANAANDFFALANVYNGELQSQFAIANLAMYNTALSSQQMQSHYNRGVGFIGELPGARVSRLLTKYWGANYTAATGTVKLAADSYWNPVSAGGQASSMTVLQAIQDIVATENGLFYVNAAGTLVFEDRSSRYSNQTSLWTFGENTAAGELPYDVVEYDFDATYMYSQANLTRPGNPNFAPMPNPPPANPPAGQRILSRQMQVTSDYDLQQAGVFYLNRYSAPRQRIRKMTISPAKNPNLFTAVLSLEISNRVTVKRRTSAGVTISDDYYVESIAHHINAREGEWTVDLELSPVFVKQAWVLGDPTYGVLGSTTVPVY